MRKLVLLFSLLSFSIFAQRHQGKFEQLGESLPTPNQYRTASGQPGKEYFQQKADYQIKVVLDDQKQTITGEEIITYQNNSPDPLPYLWIQLDQNVRQKGGMAQLAKNGRLGNNPSIGSLNYQLPDFDGGFKDVVVTTTSGKELPTALNATMLRIDLPQTLNPGQKFSFKVTWWYNINDRLKVGGRSGLEYFPDDKNYLYTIAQFYPRMAVYNDYEGWQNKQFLGQGEFTLPFGDFDVEITVPADHMVGATGTLKNEGSVLSSEERKRLNQAKKEYNNPIIIRTQEEAIALESNPNYDKTKTWVFSAKNVRDFAFASSRKFIWDAMAVKLPEGGTTMAMSYYPKEGNPLWEKYSTKAVAQTLETYSKFTFDYPYEKAISVHAKSIGMEYPMICFNGGRPEKDGTYSAATKHGMISVIIHEVGHNYFPMIVNSDERQWTWMDEGLNTFLQYLTEQEWDRDYPSRRGPAPNIVPYMKGDKAKIVPIMENSEDILQFGNNAYGKPATALNILRETVMGRELFDFAFKHYAQTWKFKHPTPADFFRVMEDASAVDLDWFWRGWFYSTDHVDIALSSVDFYHVEAKEDQTMVDLSAETNRQISAIRNKDAIKVSRVEKDSTIRDQYTGMPSKRQLRKSAARQNQNQEIPAHLEGNYVYELTLDNVGGLIMPLIFEFTFVDGSKEVFRIPAEVWLRHEDQCRKLIMVEKEVKAIELDPFLETADTDRSNNYWPSKRSVE